MRNKMNWVNGISTLMRQDDPSQELNQCGVFPQTGSDRISCSTHVVFLVILCYNKNDITFDAKKMTRHASELLIL